MFRGKKHHDWIFREEDVYGMCHLWLESKKNTVHRKSKVKSIHPHHQVQL